MNKVLRKIDSLRNRLENNVALNWRQRMNLRKEINRLQVSLLGELLS
jgi:hypothetical protein